MLRLKKLIFTVPPPQQGSRQKRDAYAYIFPVNGRNEYDARIGAVRSVVAGMGSSIATILCSHPFDVVRSRRQAKSKSTSKEQLQPQRKRDAIRSIFADDLQEMVTMVREEGFTSLYKSVGVHMFGHLLSGVIFYAAEAFLKERLYGGELPPARSILRRMGRHIFISTAAGLAQVAATHPIWVLKNRAQLETIKATEEGEEGKGKNCGGRKMKWRRRGIAGELWELGRTEGLRGLYSGIVPSLILTVHSSIQYAMYDELKTGIAWAKGAALTPLDRSLAAIGSKTLAISIANPVLMVRTRLMEKGSSYAGVADVVRRVWREEGPLAFYKGASAGLYKILAAGISQPVYDVIAYRTRSYFNS